jgi:hypothetical protein
MRRTRLALATALLCVIGAVPATAAEPAPDLSDVSKQVATLERGFANYIAKHGAVRSGRLSAALGGCGDTTTSNAFQEWGDPADYFLAPQGDFSASDRWTMNDHARVADEDGDEALVLQEGGEASSPILCITRDRPTIRFFARNDGGAESSRLEVSVLYEGADGHVKSLRVAQLRAGRYWAPAIAIPIYVNSVASFAADGTAPVVIQVRAMGVKAKLGRWQLDDLYVDPFKGH